MTTTTTPASDETRAGAPEWICSRCGQRVRVRRDARRLVVRCDCLVIHYRAADLIADLRRLRRAAGV